MEELKFKYEPPPTDTMTIEGMKYSGDYFRFLAQEPIDDRRLFRMIRREDGVVTIETVRSELLSKLFDAAINGVPFEKGGYGDLSEPEPPA